MLTGSEFGALFQSFQATAFKYEQRDFYDIEDEQEEFDLFLSGAEIPEELKQPNRWMLGMTSAGKRVGRVHAVRPPLTDYLRWELGWGYPSLIAAGEVIRILDLSENDPPGLPDHDFWLFDDLYPYRMHYTDKGKFDGAELLGEGCADEYRRYRDVAIGNAEPFETYWSRQVS